MITEETIEVTFPPEYLPVLGGHLRLITPKENELMPSSV